MLTKCSEKKLDENYTRKLHTILNKSRNQLPTKHSCMATYIPSYKLPKEDEQDMQETGLDL